MNNLSELIEEGERFYGSAATHDSRRSSGDLSDRKRRYPLVPDPPIRHSPPPRHSLPNSEADAIVASTRPSTLGRREHRTPLDSLTSVQTRHVVTSAEATSDSILAEPEEVFNQSCRIELILVIGKTLCADSSSFCHTFN